MYPVNTQGLSDILISQVLTQDDTKRQVLIFRNDTESPMATPAPATSWTSADGEEQTVNRLDHQDEPASSTWEMWHLEMEAVSTTVVTFPSFHALVCFSPWSPWREAYRSSLLLKEWIPSQCRFQLGMPSCKTQRPSQSMVSARVCWCTLAHILRCDAKDSPELEMAALEKELGCS